LIRSFCITYIIIYYYSLIYFIFGDDTYVVFSVFTCLIIIGELAAGVRILLEKGPSRHHISEDQQFQENTQKFIFFQRMEVARRRGLGEPPGAHTTWWHGPALGHATLWCGHPGPPLLAPPRVYRLPKKPKMRRRFADRLCHLCGAKNTERERKISGRQKSAGEIPSWRGEIVSIVIAIELGFIGIIIITSTIITIITTPSRCNILG
jgi:hypothetical protein